MKEYILKQKYPSLPNDWEVGMKVGLGDRNYGYPPCSGNYTDCRKLDNNEVENSKEYWEEIIEKDYEILSLETNTFFGRTTSILDIEAFENPSISTVNYKIHSVRRLSDGEVFSIEDNFKVLSGGSLPIKDFEVFENDLKVNGNYLLSRLEKYKTPILTTEDGVEIYGGEKLHLVTKCFTLGVGLNFTKDELKDYLFFAKKENAERFINLNSPKYTVLDMLKVANHHAYIKNVTEDRILKYLAKNGI